ncbi:adenylate/guanylate cyclase domain-containing protein [Aurantimonas sp. VKM B-3413]|uniref:adenylate/guanylate cyclase domain-containing protein n=1 Tax=Aurantimonas sp. VKM B-3413 TaxID=2779401 RepID=UPI001E5ADD1A|nr:adenylate/guanylate cyclase domain-containing protein [Aurantimonas sp. VKM B-3413]MCB8840565.1 GAF domain-containing protein [Aurantimonas sp. VKM B-3413]
MDDSRNIGERSEDFRRPAELSSEAHSAAAELRDVLAQQKATAEVLRLISGSAFDLDAILTTLVELAIELCEATRGVVWLKRGADLYLAAHVNYPAEWVAFAQNLAIEPSPDATTVSGRAAFTGEVLNVADILTDPRFRTLSGHQLGVYRGGLAVPLKQRGAVIGVISLSRPEPRAFTDRQVALVETFADQAVIAIENTRLIRELEARNREVLSRYFSPGLAARLANDAGMKELSAKRREISVVFTDVAGFTALVERMDPAVLGELLNAYLAAMTAIVFAHEGTVAKIVGDALHILFGAPDEQADHSERAVLCALALDRFSEELRETWRARGVALGATRIGIHSGPAIVGNFGGGRIFDYSAYGDTINVAARLEVANKRLGTRICASSAVAEGLASFRWRPIGDLLLKGRSEPLRAYEPQSPGDDMAASLDGYVAAFEKLRGGDPGAMGAFAAEVGKRPDDRLCSFHLKRLLNGEIGTTIHMDA